MKKIENREVLEQIRQTSREQMNKSKCRVLICAGTGCLSGGSGAIYDRMCELVGEHPDVEVHFGPEIAHGDGEIGVKKKRMPWLLRDGASDEDRASGNPIYKGEA